MILEMLSDIMLDTKLKFNLQKWQKFEIDVDQNDIKYCITILIE